MWYINPHYKRTTATYPLLALVYLYKLIRSLYPYLHISTWAYMCNNYTQFTDYNLLQNSLPSPQLTKSILTGVTLAVDLRSKQIFSQPVSLSKRLFQCFIETNTFFTKFYLTPHASFRQFYIFNRQNNLGVWTLEKLFCSWQNTVFLLQNVIAFDMQYLVFTSSYFRYESLALNYKVTTFFKNFWRYTTPFIFFLNNKTTLATDNYFYNLKQLHIHFFFIVDPVYHARTLHYCRKYKFLTLGPVSVASYFYTLNYPIPVATNTVFSNLFFLRLLFKFEAHVSTRKFLHLQALNHSTYTA